MSIKKSMAEALKDFDFTILSENGNEAIIKVVDRRTLLSCLGNGKVFKVAGFEFIKLGSGKDTTAAIMKNILCDSEFGDSNNYRLSKVRKLINGDFRSKIESEIGENNLINHRVDLTANDGLKEYGSVVDKVSLITADNYRRYREYLPGINDWWWTATPFSTKSNGYPSGVSCVNDSGTLSRNGCGYDGGVRPFCIFSSSIFVSF